MTKIYIKYNPYTVETEFKINNKVVSKNSTLATQSKKRLQYWLEKNNNNWNGIVDELVKACNDSKLDITFEGRTIDFEDLKLTFEKNEEVQVKFTHKEIKNDSDILNEIGELIDIFDNGPIEELKSKDIRDTYNNVKSSKFKVNVIATMSSGKSTLINALLGQELMPSQNQACTATIGRITNNNACAEFTAECRDEDENIVHERSIVTLADMQKYNEDENVTYIDIEGTIPYISSEKMNLLLVDTPGPNNSRNADHGKLTESIISDRDKGVVLYVINATQFGINDDKMLLEMIANEMKRGGKQSKDRFIFAVNKCDTFDVEKGETVESLLKNVESYLLDKGIEEPNLFPVSAQVAKLIRMSERGAELTRKEKRDLRDICDDFIETPEYHFEKMASLSESCKMKLEYRLNEARREQNDFEEAVIHTGIPAIEEAINEYLEKYAYPIKINDAMSDFKAIIEEDIMKQSLDSEISKDVKVYEKIRKQINDAKKKMKESKKADLLKAKMDKFGINEDEFKYAGKDIVMLFEKSTRKYINMEKVEKSQAYLQLEQFSSDVSKVQKELEMKLNMTIKNTVIDEGEKLINEYADYLREMESNIQIQGFTFSKMRSIQSVQINDIYDVMEEYQETEEQYEERTYKNENKKWYKFWTWGEDSYYTKSVKVGEIDYIDVKTLVQDYMDEIYQNIDENIDDSIELAKSEVKRLKAYFKNELSKLDNVMSNIIEELDRNTSNAELVKERVEENKKMKLWLDDVVERIENIVNI